jgi:uncharacterized protein (TIGR02246 family)
VLSVSFILGCTQQQQTPAAAAPKLDEAAARAAITPRLAMIGDVFGKKDAAGVSGLFTDDAVWILPDASTFKGKDEIQKGATAFFTLFDSVSAPTEVIDKAIVVSDSEVIAFVTGKYTMYPKGKKTGEAHANRFSDYWKKGSDGTWRIAYEVNADGPETPPQPAPAAKKS